MAAHRPEECDFQIAVCINAGDVRRQADGTWRFVIDYPNGGD
jgi:hypothetical protein